LYWNIKGDTLYKKIIEKQIRENSGVNLFLSNNNSCLKFNKKTLEAIFRIDEIDVETENLLIKYTSEKVIEEFYRINQYYSFSSNSKNELEKIYADLLKELKSKKHTLNYIEQNHYKNLINWLKKTNPFAEKLYPKKTQYVEPVVCAEYSAEFQIHLLRLDVNVIMEPVLDIGCGKSGNLVRYLHRKGISIQGIDRILTSNLTLVNADWLEYHFGKEKWGTIISNMSFSNHFNHHNLREDGNYIEYAKKYLEILKSLKIGGKFHYAPNLPFIETYLNNSKFYVEKHDIGGFEINTTIVTRLSS
jgi:hypothetical protein